MSGSSPTSGSNSELVDLENSIPFDLTIKLGERFSGLIAGLRQALVESGQGSSMRTSSIAQIDRTFETLLANLLRANEIGAGTFVALSRRPASYKIRSRYNAQRIGYENLIRVVDFLERMDMAKTYAGFQNLDTGYRRSSRIIATPFLINLLGSHDASVIDVEFSDGFPCIVLRDENKRNIDYGDEDDSIKHMKVKLEAWNAFLGMQWTDLWATDEEFAHLPIVPPELVLTEQQKQGLKHVRGPDLSRRRLYRVFNNSSFEYGGRFYGGWWQEIPSAWRSRVTINGHPCRELDYSNFQPAMLYAMAGEKLDGYAYDIIGLEPNERNKGAVKATFMKLIYSSPGQKVRALTAEELPEGWSWNQLWSAVKQRHAPIKKFMQSGVALRMQRIDSDITEAVMLSLMQRDILALPIHDSFLVRRGHYLALRDEMHRAYRDAMNSEIKTKLDLSFFDQNAGSEPFTAGVSATFGEFDAIVDADARKESGAYQGYFTRQRLFRSRQPREYFQRFEPY